MGRLWGPHSLLFSVKQGSFLVGSKRPERHIDHSYLAPSFRKTGILPLFLLCFYGVEKTLPFNKARLRKINKKFQYCQLQGQDQNAGPPKN